MKLELYNEAKLIESVNYEIYKGHPSLIINTKDKWREPDSRSFVLELEGNKISFDFYNDNEGSRSSVTLIPENDEDKEIVDRLPFLLHDKYQLWYIFPDMKDKK